MVQLFAASERLALSSISRDSIHPILLRDFVIAHHDDNTIDLSRKVKAVAIDDMKLRTLSRFFTRRYYINTQRRDDERDELCKCRPALRRKFAVANIY